MSLLTASQLAQRLIAAADILPGRIEGSEYPDIISRVLLLKRVSDQPGILTVPEFANWQHIIEAGSAELGHVINDALVQLERSNPIILGGVPEGVDFTRTPGREELRTLIEYFDQISLSNNNLEFSDVTGTAFDRALSWFAERSGKRGGEFFTPRSIVQLMVRLVKPEEGQTVYDPFLGSAGVLISATKYVDEHGGEGANLRLFGQEKNSFTWSLARLNLLFHGITDASVLCGDTLNQPLHVVQGQIRLFDRVITNPPFSTNYTKAAVSYPMRMRYGWTPDHGGKADLLYIQHVLATLLPDGIGAVVTPQGVLYRGGAEADIRERIVRDGRLEAVIGIGANVFHGTAIPASVLVLRGVEEILQERRDTILFINAEREVVTGRTQNRLEPATVEKIVRAFRDRVEIPGFSRVVSLAEMAQNGFNLNIRRYIDAGPMDEAPFDVRATLLGGVPAREVNEEVPRFHVFGLGLSDLFETTDSDRLSFMPEGYEVTADRIPRLAAPRAEDYISHFDRWWDRAAPRLAATAGTGDTMTLRKELIDSLCLELVPQEILDQYQLSGAFADWWNDHHDDLRSLSLRGFQGVINRWAVTRSRGAAKTEDARGQVLSTLGGDLRLSVESMVSAQIQGLVDTYREWGERYATSLIDLEARRATATARLNARLEDLGYT